MWAQENNLIFCTVQDSDSSVSSLLVLTVFRTLHFDFPGLHFNYFAVYQECYLEKNVCSQSTDSEELLIVKTAGLSRPQLHFRCCYGLVYWR